MFKILIATVIILICGTLGLLVANNFKLRPWQLRQLQSGLQMLETEIVYTATPLPEALIKTSEQLEKPVKDLFAVSGRALLSQRNKQVSGAWQDGINQLAEESALSEKDLTVIKSLGHNLGSSDSEEQIKHLQLLRAQLRQHEATAEEEKKKGEKLWRYCGFLTGLIIVLLIL